MKRLFIICNLLILCLFALPYTSYAGYQSDGWQYRGYIDLPAPDSTLTDYPALITEDMLDVDIADYMYGNGADLRWSSDSEGATPLAFDILIDGEPFAFIKVKIPSFIHTADTRIYYWLGKSDADFLAHDNAYGSDNVYPSDYKMTFDFEPQKVPAFADTGFCLPFGGVLSSPCAVYYNGVVYFTWQSTGGDPYIRSYTVISDTWSSIVQVGTSPLSGDAHGYPAITVDSSGYLHVFFGCHGTPIEHAKSDSTEDISAWTAQTDVDDGATYPHVIQTNASDYWITWRKLNNTDSVNGKDWFFSTGADLTDTTKWLENATNWDYVGSIDYDATNNYVWMTWCRYSYSGAQTRHNIYVAYIDLADDNLYSYDGDDLGVLITPTEADTNCKVVDDAVYQTGIPFLKLDSTQNPHILYTHNTATGYNTCHNIWSGSAWLGEDEVFACGDQENIPTGYFIDGNFHMYGIDGTDAPTVLGGDINHWIYEDSTWTKIRTVLSKDKYSLSAPEGFGVPFAVQNGTDDARVAIYACDESDTVNADLPIFAINSKDNFVFPSLFTYTDTTTAVVDATDNDNDGSPSGVTHTASAKVGYGMTFDGSNDSVTLNATILTGNTEYTVSGWIYPNGDNGNGGDTLQTPWALYDQYSTRLLMTETGYSGDSEHYAFEINSSYGWHDFAATTWEHVVCTYDLSDDLKIYVNGVLRDTVASVSVPAVKNGESSLGRSVVVATPQYYFKGSLDEVEVIDAALSVDYIEALYANQNDPENWPTATGDMVSVGSIPILQPVIVY